MQSGVRTNKNEKIKTIPLRRLFLWPENPRHDPVETENDSIAYLCEKEAILPIAKDIVDFGLNPLERLAFVPIHGTAPDGDQNSYHVVEGNRRLCALKLLADPDRAPTKLKAHFEKLSKGWSETKSLEGVIFEDIDEAKIWLKRIHTGAQEGIGRRSWTTEQQARFDGGNKNKDAQNLLDFAQEAKLISESERDRKITTVQRFMGNSTFREAIGIEKTADSDELLRNRPKEDVNTQVGKFMRDLVDGDLLTCP